MASGVFQKGLNDILDGTIDLLTDTLKVMFVTSAYTYDPDTALVDAGGGSDILDAEISVSGYTGGWGGSGRKTLASKTVTVDNTNNRSVFDAADPSAWTLGAGATIAAAVIIKEGGSDDTGSRPIAYLDVTDTATNGGSVTLSFAATGIFYIQS